MPLRNRLFLNYLVVLLVGMGLAALLAWRAVEGLYLDTQRENLLAQANLIATALRGQPIPASDSQPYLQTSNALPGIHTRLLSEQGAVAYSLPVMPGQMSAPPAEEAAPISADELKKRVEIASAMQGDASTAVRAVSGRRILYAAAPVMASDGSVEGIVYVAMPLPAAGLPGPVVRQLAAATTVALILALLAGTLLARRVVAPIEAVAQAAASVSGGDLTQRVDSDSTIRELNSLGDSFNAMTASLRQADQAKNAFVADVTHELRTPLTVIKGTVETLEDGALDDLTGRAALLQSMQRETDRLIRLVNGLLVLTRADAGALNLDTRPFDLADLARQRCEHFAALAERSQVQLTIAGTAPAYVAGDWDRSCQVLDNLLDNAIRYSPPHSTVTVEISAARGEFLCAVKDNGPGIAAQHLPFVFDRFYRIDRSRSRQTGGAGLGLAIAKALVLAQGGQIGAESEERKGTSIRFSLPAAKDCPPTD